MKTRLITIKRTKWIEDQKGNKSKVLVTYPCRVNSAVDDSHRMCEKW